MHIQWIDITLPPLRDIYFDCARQVNLFVGPNASGKSTILRAIQHLAKSWIEFDNGNAFPLYRCSGVNIGVNYGCPFDTGYYPQGADCAGSGTSIWEAVPFLYIPATRVNLRPQDIFTNAIVRPEPSGANLTWSDVLSQNFCNSRGSFNGEYVEDLIDHFRRELRNDRDKRNQLRKSIENGYRCAEAICNEIMQDVAPQTYIEFVNDDYLDDEDPGFYPTGRVAHHAMGIETTDDSLEEPLYAGALSSGTQGTLLWIWALAIKMAHHYGWQEGWEAKPAILLIDEIENHLHPTWQRRVIPALLEHFPGLQIFATTHSPFVVAGLKAGQVHKLARDTDGKITATTNSEDIIGWTADEISRRWLDILEPTDLLTIERAEKLRELRVKSTLTPEEELKLNTLRRQINESLLSRSGPVEAQRERYADLMQRFLQTRQSDLNQDGG